MHPAFYLHPLAGIAVFLALHPYATAQTTPSSLDTPQTRMRPIGSTSAVDQYETGNRYRETTYQAPRHERDSTARSQTINAFELQAASNRTYDTQVRQTVMLQQAPGVVAPALPGSGSFNGMTLPGGNQMLPTAPGATSPGFALPSQPMGSPTPPTFNPPPASPSLSPGSPSLPRPNTSDFSPLTQPQLDHGFATIDNCPCISAPSSYTAASGINCGVSPVAFTSTVPCGVAPYATPQPYAPPPAQIAPQVVLPSGVAPVSMAPNRASSAPVPSLFTLGQQRHPVEVGQGLWGQPKAYVPGQGIRNWMRYFFP